MSMDDEWDEGMSRLMKRLPETLQDDWVIVPKRMILNVSVVGVLLGVSLTLMIVGFVLDVPSLRLVFPLVTAMLMIATKWIPWWRCDRQQAQLRQGLASDPPST